MIEIEISKSFINDLKSLKGNIHYNKIKNFVFNELKDIRSLEDLKNLKKLKGYKEFFRLKISDYRIGLKIFENKVTFLRVLHRKDIYKYFPGR